MQLCIVTQRRRSVHEAELHGLFVLVQCLACQKICARRLQHLHTSGYILQSSRLLPWEALMTIAEKHEVFLFVSSYILCSTRQVEPRVRRTATNCKQHHADALSQTCSPNCSCMMADFVLIKAVAYQSSSLCYQLQSASCRRLSQTL